MRGWRRRGKMEANVQPRRTTMNLPEIQREYAGSWVALKGGRVVEARPTPYELVAALHSRNVRDTTIVRVPTLEEPELVGLG